ncbi:MAG: homocysteine S-methyltransferase family protein [Ignavibacterium sp.]|nr:homocysteine S-methyltransferase family protein [Ignavibacterium sp.]
MSFLNEFNIFKFSNKIKRPLILDGAMGSLLEQRGLTNKDGTWSAKINFSYPEEIIKIHKDYINAGADIITTNTFRTNPYALKRAGIDNYKMYVKKALELAKTSIENNPILIAGSNPPAEDCYQSSRKATPKELELNHCYHIETLFENGCNFILNETQSHLDEIKIICEFCSKNRIPFVISLYFDDNLKLLSGENVLDVISMIDNFNPLSISFNCINNQTINNLFSLSTSNLNLNLNLILNLNSTWGFYLNIFSEKPFSTYAELIKDKIKLNPSFVGACCGSNPDDIRTIKEFLDARNSC